jgi:hypothetical protein
MPNSQPLVDSIQPGDFMHWLLAILKKINADNRLAPDKAVQKRLQELIETYGPEKVWEAIKRYSMALGMPNASFMETLFQNYPELPDLFDTDNTLNEALNQWLDQNTEAVTRFRKTSSVMLRANPVIEWKVDPLSDVNKDFEPIMDMLFRNTEGTQ